MNSIGYVGHATVRLALGGVTIVTDPFLRRGVGPLRRVGPHPDPGLPAATDVVLISHLHRDHLDLPSLRRFPSSTTAVVPRGAARLASKGGRSEIRELAPGESTSLGRLTVRAVPAVHNGRRDGKWGREIEPLGYVLESGGLSVYFAGDTDLFEGMSEIGPVDLALLPVGAWGRKIASGRLDPVRAADALKLIRPRAAVPIHWGSVYPLGLSLIDSAPLREPPLEFERLAKQLAPEVRVSVLQPGEEMSL